MTTKGLLYDELKSQTKILNENTDTNDKLLEEQIKLEQTAYILKKKIKHANEEQDEIECQKKRLIKLACSMQTAIQLFF